MIKGSDHTNSVFEMPWWLDTVAPGKWHEAIVKDGDSIIARLPYIYDGGIVSNPVYTQTLGIWMSGSVLDSQKGNAHLHFQKEIINEICSQLPKCRSISLYLDSVNDYVLPFRWQGYRIEPTYSYRIYEVAGKNSLENARNGYGRTVLKNIRAAGKKTRIDYDSSDFSVLVELQNKTYARQRRKNPVKEEISLKVMKTATENGNGKLLVARDWDGKPHSAGFFLFDDRTCYYLMGGQDPEFKSDGSQNLLLDAAIEFASTVSKSFDFEGSMVEGIENFFRQFGGMIAINYHVSKQDLKHDLFDVFKPRIKMILGYKN